MGAQQPHTVNSNFDPTLEGWEPVVSESGAVTWINRSTAEEMEEYQFVSSNDNDFTYEVDSFNFRQNSPYLVAAKFLKREVRKDFCSTVYKWDLFLERIPLRLSKIG